MYDVAVTVPQLLPHSVMCHTPCLQRGAYSGGAGPERRHHQGGAWREDPS